MILLPNNATFIEVELEDQLLVVKKNNAVSGLHSDIIFIKLYKLCFISHTATCIQFSQVEV